MQEKVNEKDALATETIKKWSLWATGAGLIPVPLVDWAAISALQLKMIHDIAGVYETPFSESRVSSLIGSVAGGWAGTSAGYGLSHMVKALPVVGPLLGGLTVPAAAGATTYALGKVFMQHFAMGGTLLNFDPELARQHFKNEMKAAKAS